MKAALKTLILLTQESGGSSWAILGKMHELGALEAEGHKGVTAYCRQVGVDHLVEVATNLYQDDSNQSFDENMQQHNCMNTQAVLELVNNISAGDVILLKASRSERFEELANLLKDKLNGVDK
jgi:UDP-N-acetylmuramoyl-tripeptide--D-alanyl-D-alanine ligase